VCAGELGIPVAHIVRELARGSVRLFDRSRAGYVRTWYTCNDKTSQCNAILPVQNDRTTNALFAMPSQKIYSTQIMPKPPERRAHNTTDQEYSNTHYARPHCSLIQSPTFTTFRTCRRRVRAHTLVHSLYDTLR
jgi:hypothetical protein